MISALGYLQRLALVYWLGEMLFFATIFAPRVFKVLPREMAAKLQNNIFPAYFSAGIFCAIVIFVVSVLMRVMKTDATINSRKFYLGLGLTIFCGAIFIYSRVSLTPQIAALQESVLAGQNLEEFQKLHKWSVQLNGTALIGLLVLLGLIPSEIYSPPTPATAQPTTLQTQP